MLSVAIVGGGPSGVYALRELLEADRALRVTVFEAGSSAGPGSPYDARLNHPLLLANIASFELPPVVESLSDWLNGLAPAVRKRLGVDAVGEREFYPRVTLGRYFEAQLGKLLARARRQGCPVTLRTNSEAKEVACAPDGVRVSYVTDGGALQTETFDYAILCTGHRAPKAEHPLLRRAYPPPRLPADAASHVAILGASLTAIDAALSLAWQDGTFVERGSGLAYIRNPGAPALTIEMLSRRGVLPEADFYFPYPYEPLRWATAEALNEVASAPAHIRLDRAFAALAREIADADPEFARRVDLDGLDADTFADAYFAARSGAEPFAAARQNLVEARENVRARRLSGYRYALLRAHENFDIVVRSLGERDLKRFRRGLQRVFVDNYAAVPPVSVERLLALHEAGVLALRKVADKTDIGRAADGRIAIAGDGQTRLYDLAIEARGERAAPAVELPFPTLRLQVLANQTRERRDGLETPVTEDYRLEPGANPVERVFCIAAPFLLKRRPFAQGLTACEDMAIKAVAQLLRGGEAAPLPAPISGGALYLGDGLVVATPSL